MRSEKTSAVVVSPRSLARKFIEKAINFAIIIIIRLYINAMLPDYVWLVVTGAVKAQNLNRE